MIKAVIFSILLSMAMLFAPASWTPVMSTAYADNRSVESADIPSTSSKPFVESNKLILKDPVIDEAGILSNTEKQQISNVLYRLYQDDVAQAAVVIVPTTNGVAVFDYAMEVADRFKLGNKDTDNGLLMLVSVNDRKMHILTGYGIEGVLPDAVISRVIRSDITPKFKRNDYSGGILAGVQALSSRLYKDKGLTPSTDTSDSNSHSISNLKDNAYNNVIGNTEPFGLFIAGIFLGGIVTSFLGRFLGSSIVAVGFFVIAGNAGMGIVLRAILSLFLWLYLLGAGSGGGGSGGGRRRSRSRRRGRSIYIPSGGLGGSSGGSSGGFGSGGFSGGGGGFGGGGAGGSW